MVARSEAPSATHQTQLQTHVTGRRAGIVLVWEAGLPGGEAVVVAVVVVVVVEVVVEAEEHR